MRRPFYFSIFGGVGLDIEKLQKKAEEKALELINSGKLLREIDLRMIVREVLREELMTDICGSDAIGET